MRPFAMFSPLAMAGLSAAAWRQPLFASCYKYGKVALVSASVDVIGMAPGILVTQ